MTVHDGGERRGQMGQRIDGIEFAGFDERGDDCPILGTCIVAREERVLPIEGYRPNGALDGVVIGHVVIGVPGTLGRFYPVMLELSCRDRGVGVRRSGQAELTLSCELALLSGRPCDYPVCAASAYP